MTQVERLDELLAATRRLVRTVDSLSDDDLAAPSVLPGWSRAHVVAHLALNAEALAGVLRGMTEGRDVPMYASQEDRDARIEALSALGGGRLRDHFLSGTRRFQDALLKVPADGWDGKFRRVATGEAVVSRAAIPAMRHREVEIHHADLAAGYGTADWPEEFLDETFNRVVADREDGPPTMLRTPDGDVPLAGGIGPLVFGTRADLTWWLLGRGDGTGLTADQLPTLRSWR